MRNLDVASLRSAIHISETGSVSRAAKRLNMTQSAVSMQIKRLEVLLDLPLFERSSGGMKLTPDGEQLVSYARKIVDTNDVAYSRLTSNDFEGKLRVGVPVDIGIVAFPDALRTFKREFPRAEVFVSTSLTDKLRQDFRDGLFDVILTPDLASNVEPGATILRTEPLVWAGAVDGDAWRQRPLPLGCLASCAFRKPGIAALIAADIPWQDTFFSDAFSPASIAIAADMCVVTELLSVAEGNGQVLDHKGSLPDLPDFCTALQHGPGTTLIDGLTAHIVRAYG